MDKLLSLLFHPVSFSIHVCSLLLWWLCSKCVQKGEFLRIRHPSHICLVSLSSTLHSTLSENEICTHAMCWLLTEKNLTKTQQCYKYVAVVECREVVKNNKTDDKQTHSLFDSYLFTSSTPSPGVKGRMRKKSWEKEKNLTHNNDHNHRVFCASYPWNRFLLLCSSSPGRSLTLLLLAQKASNITHNSRSRLGRLL